jgi:hypothetical protein
MKALLCCVPIAASLMLVQATAVADTFVCEAAKKRAKVGVYSGNAVQVTADEQSQECRFSVNGATVGSPPRDRIVAALNTISSGGMSQLVRRGDVGMLAYALLGASPQTAISRELDLLLRNNAQALAACFENLEILKVGFAANLPSNQMFCRVSEKRRSEDRVGLGALMSVQNDLPQLELGVREGTFHHFLFVPIRYRERLPPLQ